MPTLQIYLTADNCSVTNFLREPYISHITNYDTWSGPKSYLFFLPQL